MTLCKAANHLIALPVMGHRWWALKGMASEPCLNSYDRGHVSIQSSTLRGWCVGPTKDLSETSLNPTRFVSHHFLDPILQNNHLGVDQTLRGHATPVLVGIFLMFESCAHASDMVAYTLSTVFLPYTPLNVIPNDTPIARIFIGACTSLHMTCSSAGSVSIPKKKFGDVGHVPRFRQLPSVLAFRRYHRSPRRFR